MDCEIRLKFQILVHDEYNDFMLPDKQPVPNSYFEIIENAKHWYIDILTLEHLFNFMKEYNAVIEYDGVLDDKGNSILTARLY